MLPVTVELGAMLLENGSSEGGPSASGALVAGEILVNFNIRPELFSSLRISILNHLRSFVFAFVSAAGQDVCFSQNNCPVSTDGPVLLQETGASIDRSAATERVPYS